MDPEAATQDGVKTPKKKARKRDKKTETEKKDLPRNGDKRGKKEMVPDQNQEGDRYWQFGGEMFDKSGFLVKENEKLHAWSLANVQKKGFDYRRNIKDPCRD